MKYSVKIYTYKFTHVINITLKLNNKKINILYSVGSIKKKKKIV